MSEVNTNEVVETVGEVFDESVIRKAGVGFGAKAGIVGITVAAVAAGIYGLVKYTKNKKANNTDVEEKVVDNFEDDYVEIDEE